MKIQFMEGQFNIRFKGREGKIVLYGGLTIVFL